MKNRGAFMQGLNKMIVKEIEMPSAGHGQVVVKMEYVGICGSDVHYFHSGRCGGFVVGDEEFMLGHECAGTVVEVGEGCKELKVGDRVPWSPA